MISKITQYVSLFMMAISLPAIAASKIKVVTSIPDLAWAAAEIGGTLVESKALLRGTENPHFVDAVPEFTRLVADADVVCIAGLELEVGYIPPVLSRSGNAKIQPGGKGYCEVGKGITALEKPTGPVDRSMGDVHPTGNPHFWLSPKALADGSKEIAAALGRVDPSHAADYQKGLRAFEEKMTTLGKEISRKLKPLLDTQQKSGDKAMLIEYHKEFLYFLEQYGLKSFGSIEEKPGVPPSAGHLGEVAASAKAAGVRVALAADYNPQKTLERFSKFSGIKVAVVQTMMQAAGKNKSYEEVQNSIADALLAHANMQTNR